MQVQAFGWEHTTKTFQNVIMLIYLQRNWFLFVLCFICIEEMNRNVAVLFLYNGIVSPVCRIVIQSLTVCSLSKLGPRRVHRGDDT